MISPFLLENYCFASTSSGEISCCWQANHHDLPQAQCEWSQDVARLIVASLGLVDIDRSLKKNCEAYLRSFAEKMVLQLDDQLFRPIDRSFTNESLTNIGGWLII